MKGLEVTGRTGLMFTGCDNSVQFNVHPDASLRYRFGRGYEIDLIGE